MSYAITCGGCDASWTALGTAHCSGCHRTFATTQLFDRHRSLRGEHGTCLDPATIRFKRKRTLFYRDDMWRGPEMETAAKKRARPLTARSR